MLRIILILLTLCPLTAHAFLIRDNYKGTRAMGMGNAFTAMADDKDALWYNPAGLARIDGYHGNLFDFNLGVDSQNTLSRIGNAVFHGDYQNLIRRDLQSMNFSVKPTFVTPYFGLSFFDQISSFTDFRDMDNLDAQADVYAYNDIGMILGFGVPFGDYVSGGVSFRLFQRTGIDTSVTLRGLLSQIGLIDPTEFESAIYRYLEQSAGTGWAVGMNIGALVRIPLATKTTKLLAAVSIEDVGFTSFRAFGDATVPARIPYRYNAGLALRYTLSRTAEFNVAADFKDYYSVGNAGTTARRIAIGAELKNHLFGIRTGIHQGYPTAGLSITTPPHTQIHFATYANELGTGFHERMQRMWMIQLVIGFNPI